MNIIIVDDETQTTDNLRQYLQQLGHNVVGAYDGREAYYLIGESYFDVAILDVNLPGMSGLDLLKFIKKNKMPTRVIMITGYATMEEMLARAAGSDEYLTKPFEWEQVAGIIQGYQA